MGRAMSRSRKRTQTGTHHKPEPIHDVECELVQKMLMMIPTPRAMRKEHQAVLPEAKMRMTNWGHGQSKKKTTKLSRPSRQLRLCSQHYEPLQIRPRTKTWRISFETRRGKE
jgi:hypothetical protein